ncbi:MAG: radical SAM protein [Candidatus Omnitrophota bacterium]
MTRDYKYIYGPVSSWRLGRSLGVDPISSERKICNFDCLYCQIGKAKAYTGRRKIFVPTADIINEIKRIPPVRLDYITFSGMGEPTLAKNLGLIIRAIRKIRKEKIAVLTNSSLIYKKDVQDDLRLADFVAVKLDVSSEALFKKVNRPKPGLKFYKILKGIKDFRARFKGKLALQIMLTERNRISARGVAVLTEYIDPDEVQINTPLRPCGVKPLSRQDIKEIKSYFKDRDIISVYDAKKKKARPVSTEGVFRRRGEA